jgi:hypothetical protein
VASANYPTSPAGRQQLADRLTAKGLTPTQGIQSFNRAKINAMADAMQRGLFDWQSASLEPVILGPRGQVLNGHHRVIAAELAGIDLANISAPMPQVRRLSRNYRPEFRWVDVLPDVP